MRYDGNDEQERDRTSDSAESTDSQFTITWEDEKNGNEDHVSSSSEQMKRKTDRLAKFKN